MGAEPAAGPSLAAGVPDCFTAYGATNDELSAYGTAFPLTTASLLRPLLLQTGVLVLLVAASVGLAVRGGSGWLVALLGALTALAALSALVTLLRLSSVAARLVATPTDLSLTGPLGRTSRLAWAEISEIALLDPERRPLVGLRVRDDTPPAAHGPLGAARRPLAGGCDWLLLPAGGDAALLGRVLFRYCIDAAARRRRLGAFRD